MCTGVQAVDMRIGVPGSVDMCRGVLGVDICIGMPGCRHGYRRAGWYTCVQACGLVDMRVCA